MAQTNLTLSYIGTGPTGTGQTIVDQTSGPKAKTLFGYGTYTVGSGTWCTTSAVPVYWIDGTASLGKTYAISFWAVDASDGTNSVYYSVGPDSSLIAGDVITVTGFSVSANNVTAATVASVGSNFVKIANTSGTKEAGPIVGAQGVYNRGGIPDVVLMWPAQGHSGDTAAAVAACTPAAAFLSSITAKGATLTTPNLTSTGSVVTFGFILEFAS